MYTKISITGCLEIVSGLHIGASNAFSAIGSVDAPVVRDALDRIPMIPGSSLKGKMRTLLAKMYNEKIAKEPDEDDERLLRLFGSSLKNSKYKTGRLLFADMIISNADELRKRGAESLTEIKFENTINRCTAVANPRQIERVIRGAKFDLDIVYEFYGQGLNELVEDFEIICDGFRLLEYDYLGGSGSRGYGRVSFSGLSVKTVFGKPDGDVEKTISGLLARVGDGNGE